MLLSHLPGLPLVAGVAMDVGAMSTVMLQLPLTSVLLPTPLLGSDGLTVMPLVIVAVAVAYIASLQLTASPQPEEHTAPTAGGALPPGYPGRLNVAAGGQAVTARTRSW
jgi:hypothetical protein